MLCVRQLKKVRLAMVESVTGYTGHDAAKLRDYNENNHALSGHEMSAQLQRTKSMQQWVLFVLLRQLVPRERFPA